MMQGRCGIELECLSAAVETTGLISDRKGGGGIGAMLFVIITTMTMVM